jgi:Fe-S-cluster containining protein
MKDFKQKFYDITSLIQAEFDRNLEIYGDKIQCRKGCSQCCSQIFRITKIDGWMISEHVRSLPEPRKTELQQKAREYLSHHHLPLQGGEKEHTKGVFAEGVLNTDHPGSPSHPSLKKEGSYDTPCPALGTEGECTIYEARPVICRRFGMPIYDYKNPTNVHACELNFKNGDEITDDKLIINQTKIGVNWDELKEEFNNAPPLNKSKTEGVEGTTIAEAIANA